MTDLSLFQWMEMNGHENGTPSTTSATSATSATSVDGKLISLIHALHMILIEFGARLSRRGGAAGDVATAS